METLGPLPRTLNGNHIVLFLTDRFTKVKWFVPKPKTTALHIMSLFLDKWVLQYGIPENGLTERWKTVHPQVLRVAIGPVRYWTSNNDCPPPVNRRAIWVHQEDENWTNATLRSRTLQRLKIYYICCHWPTCIIARYIDRRNCLHLVLYHDNTPEPHLQTILEPYRLMLQRQHLRSH